VNSHSKQYPSHCLSDHTNQIHHTKPDHHEQDVISMENTQSVHHINHMTHALPFGIPCSETMSVHARLVKATLVPACTKLACTRCMHM